MKLTLSFSRRALPDPPGFFDGQCPLRVDCCLRSDLAPAQLGGIFFLLRLCYSHLLRIGRPALRYSLPLGPAHCNTREYFSPYMGRRYRRPR